MKTLDFKQMEQVEGGGWFWPSYTCTAAALAYIGFTVGTGGVGALIGAGVFASACGITTGMAIDGVI